MLWHKTFSSTVNNLEHLFFVRWVLWESGIDWRSTFVRAILGSTVCHEHVYSSFFFSPLLSVLQVYLCVRKNLCWCRLVCDHFTVYFLWASGRCKAVVLCSPLCCSINAFKPRFVSSCASATHCFQKWISINETWWTTVRAHSDSVSLF